MAEDLVVDPIGRQRYVFTPAADGDALHVEGWVDPGGSVPPHVHPVQEERFRVLEGEMELTVGRDKVRAGAGESAVVPPQTRHAFACAGSATAHFTVDVTPGGDLAGFLADFAAAGRAGYLVKLGPATLPKTPKGLLAVCALLRHHRAETVLLSPPLAVQRILMDPLAGLGERRGLGPGLARHVP